MPSMWNHPTKTLTEIRLLKLPRPRDGKRNLSKLIRVRFLLLIWVNWTTWQSTNRNCSWVWSVLTAFVISQTAWIYQLRCCFSSYMLRKMYVWNERKTSILNQWTNNKTNHQDAWQDWRQCSNWIRIAGYSGYVVNPLHWSSFSITFHRSSCITPDPATNITQITYLVVSCMP